MDTQRIHISDYNYPLPDERIAKFPLKERDHSKLLVYKSGEISDDIFYDLPEYLPKGALMVFNNTKVIRARLHFRKSPLPTSPKGEESKSTTVYGLSPLGEMAKPEGALIEIFLLEPCMPAEYQENFASKGKCQWYCLVGNSKKWKQGKLTQTLTIDGQTIELSAERLGTHGTSQIVEFCWSPLPTSPKGEESKSTTVSGVSPLGEMAKPEGAVFSELLEAIGELPIPPYLNRKTEESDLTTYQTVYSKIKGSVAAPTAGLHFTERVLKDLDAHGIEREEVTLHVGAGTFKPVKSEEIGGHDMHTEHIAVHRSTIEKLIRHSGQAIAVGTTSVRTLESLYYMGVLAQQLPSPSGEGQGEALHVPQWMPYEYAQEEKQLTTVEALQALIDYLDRHNMDVLHSSTQIIIAPGYNYKIVKMMVTNFHQPQSTLLLLVSAFINQPQYASQCAGDWHKIYDYALSHDFRFLSYGDSSLLIP